MLFCRTPVARCDSDDNHNYGTHGGPMKRSSHYPNRYSGRCLYCLASVPAREGYWVPRKGDWRTVCQTCFSLDASAYLRLAHSLDPYAVSRYLSASREWTRGRREASVSETWRLKEPGSRHDERILLPLGTRYPQFFFRFAQALSALGRLNACPPAELRDRLLHGDPAPETANESGHHTMGGMKSILADPCRR